MIGIDVQFDLSEVDRFLTDLQRTRVPAAAPRALNNAAFAYRKALQAEIGVPARLRDIGVPESLLAPIALKVMSERGLYFNPRQVSGPHEVEDMLGRAW